MALTTFRRAFVDHDEVRVETDPGVFWRLPNPSTENGTRRYDPRTVLKAVIAAGEIETDRWEEA
jgi:hypothetical protein